MNKLRTYNEFITESRSITWYHGTNHDWTDNDRNKLVYWTNDKKLAIQYGKKLKSFNMSAKEYYDLPVYDALGAEWDLEKDRLSQIERALLSGKPLDIWGQILNIDKKTKAVLITNIVDPPDGSLDIDDEEFYKNNHKYTADILITKKTK